MQVKPKLHDVRRVQGGFVGNRIEHYLEQAVRLQFTPAASHSLRRGTPIPDRQAAGRMGCASPTIPHGEASSRPAMAPLDQRRGRRLKRPPGIPVATVHRNFTDPESRIMPNPDRAVVQAHTAKALKESPRPSAPAP